MVDGHTPPNYIIPPPADTLTDLVLTLACELQPWTRWPSSEMSQRITPYDHARGGHLAHRSLAFSGWVRREPDILEQDFLFFPCRAMHGYLESAGSQSRRSQGHGLSQEPCLAAHPHSPLRVHTAT
ncbi:hypothetical protein E2562_022386 [Oryza meyeriana var. granulata]|uniref:Uncharacterized protein n=1 Tax=Oryza meyeriana var. granulata TaxID=110450 RepID=A0A6G1EYB5_9ORYZ|nr:hypothetical protein E2562_022386 [Oryza meyeriana var. granulata]